MGGCGALRRCGCAWTYERTQFLCVKFRLGSAGEPTICSHCSVQYMKIPANNQVLFKACWFWFVILKRYVELTRPKIESRDPMFFTGTRACLRVSGNDRLFPHGSKFGPNWNPCQPRNSASARITCAARSNLTWALARDLGCCVKSCSSAYNNNGWISSWI